MRFLLITAICGPIPNMASSQTVGDCDTIVANAGNPISPPQVVINCATDIVIARPC